jgi:hypothetical protein
VGAEFLVNTHTNASQIRPVVAAESGNEFLVAWSSFMVESSFDVRGQRYLALASPGPGSGSESAGSESSINTPPPPGTFPLPPPLPGTGSGSGSSSSSTLRVGITIGSKGKRLTWNTEPGGIYQVQYATNLARWENLGEARTATTSSDSIPVGSSASAGFYRVIRVP